MSARPPTLPVGLAMFDDGDSESLFARILAGDGDAAAEFLLRYQALIVRRVGARLNPPIQGTVKLDEIMADLECRLRALVSAGQVYARSLDEFWAFVLVLAQNVAVRRARRPESSPRTAKDRIEWLRQLFAARSHRIRPGELRALLTDENLWTILRLTISGHTPAQIAVEMRVTEVYVRMAWSTIRRSLRSATVDRDQPDPG